MAKNIILSFDYELFFGDNPGTLTNSLIEPTCLLLDALDSIKAKATFFVDYLMVKRMLEVDEETRQEAQLVIKQLNEIVRRGHRIELHIHPHWVDAKRINGSWDFSDFSHYCLNSFEKEEITRFFVEGTELLESIVHDVDPTYKIIAFRAGGWAILPFSLMKEGFRAAGIKIDSSAIHNYVIRANDIVLDFSGIPDKSLYRFTDDIGIVEADGEFYELQIGSFRHTAVSTLLNIYYHKRHPELFHKLTDGSHFRKNEIKKDSVRQSKWKILHQTQFFGLSGLPSFLLNHQLRRYKHEYVVLISHPKDLMPITCHNIKKLKGFKCLTYNDVLKCLKK